MYGSQVKEGFVKAAVSRAVRVQQCPLRELRLYDQTMVEESFPWFSVVPTTTMKINYSQKLSSLKIVHCTCILTKVQATLKITLCTELNDDPTACHYIVKTTWSAFYSTRKKLISNIQNFAKRIHPIAKWQPVDYSSISI